MWNGKYIEIDSIIDSLFRDNEYRDEFQLESVIEWAGEAMELIGSDLPLVPKVTDGDNSLNHPDPIIVSDYRALLPVDLHKLVGVRNTTSKIRYKSSDDSFHMAFDAEDIGNFSARPSYIIKGNFIFLDQETDSLEISYLALPISLKGFPLIPDNIAVSLAVRYHIQMKMDYKLFRKGSLNQNIYQDTVQQRDWYIGKAQTALNIPSEDEMESIKNIRLRLRPALNDWENFFKSVGNPERRNIGNSPNRNNVSNNNLLDLLHD